MLRSLAFGLALGLAAMSALQGCGGGGGSTTITTTAITTVTTTATATRTAPGGLRYCEDISTFYRVNFDANGTKSAAGQCMPSIAPGAYYTKAGEKSADGKSDREWACWNQDMPKSQWTNEAAKSHDPPFEGACIFEDFDSKVTPGEVDACSKHLSHHPAVCSPGPTMYWGACWSSQSESWKCIPKNDGTISGLAKGDCKAQVLFDAGAPTEHFYDGVCRFEEEKPKVYKCDTVHGYSTTSASTCGGGNKDVDKACFTLKKGYSWQCYEKKDTVTVPCDWALLPETSPEFYTGYCVFPGDEAYKNALDAHNLTATLTHHMIV